jgi:predicted RNA-binding protein with TRAM domain
MTKKCPTCGGDGIVISETSAAVDVERRLRALAAGSRHQAYRVEVAAKVASLLIGPGASKLVELERQTRRRFYLQAKENAHLDHFVVLEEGKRDELASPAPISEGAKLELELVEVGLHDPQAGVGKVDGFDVCVENAAKLVGKRVEVQVERVLDGAAYATLTGRAAEERDVPISAEGEAEKPTRSPRPAAKKEEADVEGRAADETAKPKKKTRRGSRGGRGRKKKTAAAAPAGNGVGEQEQIGKPVAKIHVPDSELGEEQPEEEPVVTEDGAAPKPKKKTRRGTRGGRGRKKKTATTATAGNGAGEATQVAKIHVPDPGLGEEPTDAEEPVEAPSEDGAEASKPKKKTRRGTRGGRNRRKKPGQAESTAESETAPEWEYVPMSEWADDVLSDK